MKNDSITKYESLVDPLEQQPTNPLWNRFVIWGAGRDGKDLIHALSPAARRCIYCLVDVDDKKIAHGVYEYGHRRVHPPPSQERKPSENETPIPMRIPIVHFSLLARDEMVRNALYRAWKEEDGGTVNGMAPAYGEIDKTNKAAATATNSTNGPPVSSTSSQKRRKTANPVGRKRDPGVAMLDLSLLPTLPVLVCVAMYRTGGALERNVSLIGRTEGQDLWHFS